MKILALEFSSEQRSVAVLRAAEGDSYAFPLSRLHGERPPLRGYLAEIIETGGRSTRGLGMVEQALRETQLEREQIEILAIGLGPGSYNGIRAAIGLGQGWQLARNVKLLGISSVECLAAQAHEAGIQGRVNVVIDAQRGEFYLAQYDIHANGWRELEPLRLASWQEVQASLSAGHIVVGPDRNAFASGRVLFPRAAVLAQLALARRDYIMAEMIQPIYLRETTFVKAPPPRTIPK
jgi:tRNA threonylcarbamoyl adenosine modification protein YeaZ